MPARRDLVRPRDGDSGEAGFGEPVLVLSEGQRSGDASDGAAALGSLGGGEMIFGQDVITFRAHMLFPTAAQLYMSFSPRMSPFPSDRSSRLHGWAAPRIVRFGWLAASPGCVSRAAGRLDEYVAAVITARLARPDAADLLTPGVSEPDLPDLRRRAVTLRELLNEQARLHASGVIDAQQLAAGSTELRSELTAVESRLASGIRRDPLDGIAGRRDAAAIWDNLDLGRQRAVLTTLCTVTLGPAMHGRLPGGAYLDTSPTAIQFTWRQ